MRFVTKFLIMLSLVLCLSFCFSGVSRVYAADGTFNFTSPFAFPLYYVDSSGSPAEHSVDFYFNKYSWTNSYPMFGIFRSVYGEHMRFAQGLLELPARTGFLGLFAGADLPLSISVSGLDYQDLSFELPIDFKFIRVLRGSTAIAPNKVYIYDYTPVATFTGTATVSFSDGSTKTIKLYSTDSITFSAKKDNRTNMFNLASDSAFDLSTDNTFDMSTSNKFNMSTDSSFKMATKDFDISSTSKFNVNGGTVTAPVSGQVSGEATLPRSLTADINAGGRANFGTRGANGVIRTPSDPGSGYFDIDNVLALQDKPSGNYEKYFTMWATRMYISVVGGSINMTDATITFASDTALTLVASLINAKVDSFTLKNANMSANDSAASVGSGSASVSSSAASVVDGKASVENSDVEALVEISRAEPFITVTGFTVTGYFTFLAQSFVPCEPISYSWVNPDLSANNLNYAYFGYNSFYTYGESEDMLAHMAATLDKIYYALRYDLPLELRHLIIPTTEEVTDVIEDAVEDVKNNAGGLGEAVSAVESDIKSFQDALTSGKASPLKIPAGIVNVNGTKYTLWNEFDVSPYFQLKPIKDMISYLVPFLEFLVGSAVIYHLYYMWISLLSGASYFGFLKGINTLYDSGDDN